ncbi:MAG: putative Ig domain-containing protein, partial [Gemmatimonadota bacterium]|nr:putative Ig domain-containing protein [Gemmatimonadota bacterium]
MCTGLTQCNRDVATGVVTPPLLPGPALAATNGIVALVADAPISYDATKSGTLFTNQSATALTYSIALVGAPAGLSISGGVISGTPTEPGVISATLTATDARGRTARDDFQIVVFASGLPTPTLPAVPFQYADAELPVPAHFTANATLGSAVASDNAPVTNPITDAGATLGRVLFYDSRLSANDATSCSSCHVQAFGFSGASALSVGFAGAVTTRHSPGLTNVRYYKRGRFFWDERAATLEAQVIGPIQSPVEMGMSLENLVIKLTATPYYGPLFAAAFGSPAVTSDRIAKALAQYTRSLVSTASRYDLAYSATGVPNFTASFTTQEQAGELLFRTNGCASCHNTASQVSDSVHNIGLDAVPADTGAVNSAFKAPSLRNVAVRPRYMHDGRFSSLEEIIEFFDSGVQPSPGLDIRLRNADGSPRRLNMSASQKAAVIAYLKTLTDSTFLTAPRFSSPFVPEVVTLPPTTAPPPVPPTTVPPQTIPNTAVTIQFTAYHPPTVTVSKGSAITITNLDNSRHSATFSSA